MNLTEKGRKVLDAQFAAPVLLEHDDGMMVACDDLSEALDVATTAIRLGHAGSTVIYMAVGAVTKNKKGKVKHVQVLENSDD